MGRVGAHSESRSFTACSSNFGMGFWTYGSPSQPESPLREFSLANICPLSLDTGGYSRLVGRKGYNDEWVLGVLDV